MEKLLLVLCGLIAAPAFAGQSTNEIMLSEGGSYFVPETNTKVSCSSSNAEKLSDHLKSGKYRSFDAGCEELVDLLVTDKAVKVTFSSRRDKRSDVFTCTSLTEPCYSKFQDRVFTLYSENKFEIRLPEDFQRCDYRPALGF